MSAEKGHSEAYLQRSLKGIRNLYQKADGLYQTVKSPALRFFKPVGGLVFATVFAISHHFLHHHYDQTEVNENTQFVIKAASNGLSQLVVVCLAMSTTHTLILSVRLALVHSVKLTVNLSDVGNEQSPNGRIHYQQPFFAARHPTNSFAYKIHGNPSCRFIGSLYTTSCHYYDARPELVVGGVHKLQRGASCRTYAGSNPRRCPRSRERCR